MQLKELIDTMSYGTHYKLIGANTGKQLANSYTNREGHIKAFYNDEVSGFFPSFDARNDHITKTPGIIRPIICIWLTGR